MEHLLTCSCGRKIPVSRSQAGQDLTCQCGQRLQVPTLRGFANLPLAQPETLTSNPYSSAATPDAEGPRQAWGGWRGTVMAIAVVVFAISVIPCGLYTYTYFRIDASYDVEDEIAAGNAAYDEMPLENLVAEWSNLERTGLGPKDKPEFYHWKLYARENKILSIITGSIVALSALTAIGLWVSAPKSLR